MGSKQLTILEGELYRWGERPEIQTKELWASLVGKWVQYKVERKVMKFDSYEKTYINRELHCGDRYKYAEIDIDEINGYFEVTWRIEYQFDVNATWRTDRHSALVGQFEKLKDAERCAVDTAIKLRDVNKVFAYHESFRERQVRIEELHMQRAKPKDKMDFSPTEFEDAGFSIQSIVLDMELIQRKKQEKIEKETKKKARLEGEEDTRVMVKVLLNIDMVGMETAIADYLQNEISVVDGVGADGDSVYNVDDVQVEVKTTGDIEATFYLERESGKFTSADELGEEITSQLGTSGTVEVPIEVSQ